MYVRLHSGTIKAGMRDEARAVYDELASQMLAQYPACRAVYRLEQGDRFIGLSFWTDREQMEAYAQSDLARAAHRKAEPYLIEHSVTWYEVVRENLPPGARSPFTG